MRERGGGGEVKKREERERERRGREREGGGRKGESEKRVVLLKQKTEDEIGGRRVGSEMGRRDRRNSMSCRPLR
ncbi:hypothetical protein [Escherichia coli]|uniref:hypothetical protein n=1 Tax=Escherichia coli TaxID=562 RepID=UPI00098A4BCF|nr:hypothetical protein [Escherichia coli]